MSLPYAYAFDNSLLEFTLTLCWYRTPKGHYSVPNFPQFEVLFIISPLPYLFQILSSFTPTEHCTAVTSLISSQQYSVTE